MSDKLPRWDCRNHEDRRLLGEWTNAQLDLMDQPTDELDFEMMSDEKYFAAMEQHYNSMVKRGRLITAAETKDIQMIERLTANDPKLMSLALRVLAHKPGRGRKKGEPRPADMSEPMRLQLEYASKDVDSIKELWKDNFNKQNRSEQPTATAIAARRNGVDEDRLINWRKNH
jgi:hypothetical protein